MGAPTGPRRADQRPLHDRLVFKPFAILLLIPVVLIASGLMAMLLAPPFVGAAVGVKRLDQKITALGADFTRIPHFPERSTIYANDGTTVLATVYLDNRELIRLNKVSEVARSAVLAIEDAGFYEHGPLNWTSLVRATIANARAGEVVEGGSTITQQLVKNTLGLDRYDRSFERKLQEFALAVRVEKKYTKDQIFELYLNQVYLANGVYGIGTASEYYFGKPASKLTLTEGATLAGMIRAPSDYDPIAFPKRTRIRRNDVLNRMIGQGILPVAKGQKAKATPLGLANDAGKVRKRTQPYFVTNLVRQILDNPTGEFDALGKSVQARKRKLFEGGLRITTTFDPKWQAYAQAAANAPWATTPYHPPSLLAPDVSIVSEDVATGAIRTLLSGRNYEQDKLDLAGTAHAPGSSFKPYILAAAFEQGIPPTQTYPSKSPYFPPGGWPGSSCNCVTNAEGPGNSGLINLYTATTDSVNVVFAQLIQDVGAQNVVDMAYRMGVSPSTELLPVLSLATGSVPVTPMDQASGFQTLANGGVHCVPYTVESITDERGQVYKHQPKCTAVIKPETAHQVTAMLQSVVTSGTGSAASLGSWPVAGKTGTANGNTNVWFVGYTRQVVTAVWVGPPGVLYSMGDVFGGTVAAPIWRAYMSRVMLGMPAQAFPSAPPPPQGTVPNVVGLAQGAAENKLAAAGFQVSATVVHDAAPKGTVVAQTPGGGTVTGLGTIVMIDVSDGVPAVGKVPKVVGLSVDQATAALKQAGFVVKVVNKIVTSPGDFDKVLAQSPAAGQNANQGTAVTITVGTRA
jgi:membrane peptidoglycan carboxypeptidase